jgi:hypothetical protein
VAELIAAVRVGVAELLLVLAVRGRGAPQRLGQVGGGVVCHLHGCLLFC